MKTLSVQDRLKFAQAAVAVLRGIEITRQEMTYGDFAAAIGIKTKNEKWKVWHRNQVEQILNLAAAAERQGRPSRSEPLSFERLINRSTGRPGKGHEKKSRITKR